MFLSTITFIKKTIVKISLPAVLVKLGKLYIYILIKLKGDVAEIVEHVVQVIQEMRIDTTDSATKKREDRYHLVHKHLQEINKKLDATWGYA